MKNDAGGPDFDICYFQKKGDRDFTIGVRVHPRVWHQAAMIGLYQTFLAAAIGSPKFTKHPDKGIVLAAKSAKIAADALRTAMEAES